MSRPRVALATAATAWDQDEDAPFLVPALDSLGVDVAPAVWDDPGVDWAGFDLVVVRSTWDYTSRLDQFLAWADAVEAVTRLANPARVLRWNTDKRYLGELTADGLAVVPTSFLLADDPDSLAAAADLLDDATAAGDIVVKPTVSAGSKDTARYTPAERSDAVEHARRLLDGGRNVMVQPYLSGVDRDGETGMVFLRGELSHGFRKGPLLLGGAADVDGLFAVEQIEPREPSPAEVELGLAVVAACERRCGVDGLLYARVDVLPGPDGEPIVLEAELTEPSLFLEQSAGAAHRAAAAVLAVATEG
jgi:glutathione synthase/RimK-type ligase-like ATP-grasp enzyme